MKIKMLAETLDLINEAQKRILRAKCTIEADMASSSTEWDNVNGAFEHLNRARIYIKESIS